MRALTFMDSEKATLSAFTLLSVLTFLLVISGCTNAPPDVDAGDNERASEAAAQILDDDKTEEERQEIIQAHSDAAPAILEEMVEDLEPGTDAEYDRIPWIWRVTVAAGQRNDAEEMRRIMEISTPEMDAPLHDWQAVVLGGGILNGISRAGGMPTKRVNEILEGHEDLQRRWERAVDLSSDMADDESVPNPTRFDALLMLGVESWDERGEQLVKYLAPEHDAELQLGAVLGLSYMHFSEVPEALLTNLDGLAERPRNVALSALVRTEARADALLDAVEAGTVTPDQLGDDRIEQLRNHDSPEIRTRAGEVLPD